MTMPPSTGQEWYSCRNIIIAVVIAAATSGVFFFKLLLLPTQTDKERVWSCCLVFLDFHLLSRLTCVNKHEASPQPYKFPATIKRDSSVRFHHFIVLLMFVQGYKKIYRLDMIIYPAPIIQCYLYRRPLTVCTVYTVFNTNVPIILYYIFLVRRTRNISNSKQDSSRHLNSLR